MTAADFFGDIIFLLGLFLIYNIYEADGQMVAAMITITGFCVMISFTLARIFQ